MTTESPVTVDLERLEELAKAATPGPWVARLVLHGRDRLGNLDSQMWTPGGGPRPLWNSLHATEADAEYVAALVNAAPALIAENRRLARLGELDVERLARALWAWGFDATGPVIRDDVKGPTEGQRRMARKLAAEYARAAALQESHDAD